ncbi:hypothetical protein GDO78_002958 [Eleutherodactylus coqui]|uniref:Uncharacterized protein n=1 Tax=Eleutherodactylus coqui TaxID=57060 RepID=A0A8J6EUD5_ELECQ|nr:hypothetical protein GDO78_002958 [Eleutherodactylus coqui]
MDTYNSPFACFVFFFVFFTFFFVLFLPCLEHFMYARQKKSTEHPAERTVNYVQSLQRSCNLMIGRENRSRFISCSVKWLLFVFLLFFFFYL